MFDKKVILFNIHNSLKFLSELHDKFDKIPGNLNNEVIHLHSQLINEHILNKRVIQFDDAIENVFRFGSFVGLHKFLKFVRRYHDGIHQCLGLLLVELQELQFHLM